MATKRNIAILVCGLVLAGGVWATADRPNRPPVELPATQGIYGKTSLSATPFGTPQPAANQLSSASLGEVSPPALITPSGPPIPVFPEQPEGTDEKHPPKPLYAFACGADPVEVRDPLDAANPYKGQYAPYDVWIYAQAWQQVQVQQMGYGNTEQPGSWYSLAVDDAGWPVPLNVEQELYYSGAEERKSCRLSISAYGFMGTTLEEMQQRDLMKVKARYLPTVPPWLAEGVQEFAMLLPDGEVVSEGPLGRGLRHDDSSSASYYRYGADGTELGSTPGPEWWRLYWPEFDKLEAQYPESRWLESDGYITRYKAEDGTPLETWDYHGKRLRGTAPPAASGAFEWLSAESLRELYANQTGDPTFSLPSLGA